MEVLKKYLKDALGVETELKPVAPDKLKTLPIFIVNEYDFQLIELYRHDLLLVFVNNSFTTERLKKHLDIIKAAFNINTVAVIRQLEAYNRLRLVEKKVPFIIPGKQMYMPDLLIDLKEFGVNPRNQPATMQPATQFLLLYHLQVESLEGINFKEIAKKTGYNAMTISRVAYYLQDIGLSILQGTKDKYMRFESKCKDLWKKAEPLMSSPVKKVVYMNAWSVPKQMDRSNINALAHYTDVNDDEKTYYAVNARFLKFSLKHLVIVNPKEGRICIEAWKYNPRSLSNTNFVDPLSLYLCFRGNSDERIEIALEQMINNVKW
jgi:hypothetical protein